MLIAKNSGGDVNNSYCVYCCDEQGKLKPREQVREGMIQFFIRQQNMPKEQAEKFVDDYIKKTLAWQ